MLDQFLDPDDEEFAADKRVKPALLTLLHDQAELVRQPGRDDSVDYSFRTGFPDRRRLIEWYQRAAVRTLGNIADDWPPIDCFGDETLLAATIHDTDRLGIEAMDDEPAKRLRSIIESAVLIPACNHAYRDLRGAAGEYILAGSSSNGEATTEASYSDLDPSSQSSIAMRPGFQTIDRQQQVALDEWWGGFESIDGLLDWVQALNSPAVGEVSEELQEIVTDDTAVRHLVDERHTDVARTYRELIACAVVIPDFVAGIKSMETSELAKASSEHPTTMRMKGGIEYHESS